MSGPYAEDELLQDFLDESCALLAHIDKDLLAMERDGAQIDERTVTRVFRAAHSVKGGAGFFDLPDVRELSHKIENVLDLIRCRQMVPTAQVVNVLLPSFGKLRELIRCDGESGQADIARLVAALAGLTVEHLPADEKHLIAARVAIAVPEANTRLDVSAFDLSQAHRKGKCIYLIRFDLIHDLQRKGKTPWEVFKSLMECGTILETSLDLDSAGALDGAPANQLLLEVLYATSIAPQLIGRLMDLPPQRILLAEARGIFADAPTV